LYLASGEGVEVCYPQHRVRVIGDRR